MILIFADSKEHLDSLLQATDDFMKYARIRFNPNKCKIIVNNPSHRIILDIFLPDKQRIWFKCKLSNRRKSEIFWYSSRNKETG
jgi:hypothetical protein